MGQLKFSFFYYFVGMHDNLQDFYCLTALLSGFVESIWSFTFFSLRHKQVSEMLSKPVIRIEIEIFVIFHRNCFHGVRHCCSICEAPWELQTIHILCLSQPFFSFLILNWWQSSINFFFEENSLKNQSFWWLQRTNVRLSITLSTPTIFSSLIVTNNWSDTGNS